MTLDQAEVWARERTRQVAMELAVLRLCGVDLEQLTTAQPSLSARREQGIGEFCGGTCLEECSRQFGQALWLACRTCPN